MYRFDNLTMVLATTQLMFVEFKFVVLVLSSLLRIAVNIEILMSLSVCSLTYTISSQTHMRCPALIKPILWLTLRTKEYVD